MLSNRNENLIWLNVFLKNTVQKSVSTQIMLTVIKNCSFRAAWWPKGLKH